MSPKMKEALADILAAGSEGASRKNWHGATVAALLRSDAIETVPGDSNMVRVPKTSADSARVTASEQVCPCGMTAGQAYHKRHCPAREDRDTMALLKTSAEGARVTAGAVVPGEVVETLAAVDRVTDAITDPRDGDLAILAEASQAPGFMIDFGPLSVPVYRVHGHPDRDHHLVASDPSTVTLRPVSGGMEWTYDRAEVYRVGGDPLLTVRDVSALMSPEEAVATLHRRARAWDRRRKASKARGNRKGR